MGLTRWFSASLALGLAITACGSGEQKKSARSDDGGEGGGGGAGDGGQVAVDAPGGAAGSTAGAGAASDGGSSNPDGGTSNTDGGTSANTSGGALGGGGEPSGVSITINGLVVAANEHPLSGVTIEVQGQSVVTDANGAFVLDALAPYDLVVRSDVFADTTYAYLGLTRSDPKLYFNGVPTRSATLTGVVSGGAGFPQPSGHRTNLTARGGLSSTFVRNLAAVGSYSSLGEVSWLDTPTVTTTLFGLQVDTTDSPSGVITAMGSKQITLTDQEALQSPEADLVLSSVSLHDFTVNLSGPPGFTFDYCTVSLGDFGISTANPGSVVTVQVPDGVPDAVGLAVSVSGQPAGHLYTTRVVPGDATSVDIDFAPVPTLTMPDDLAPVTDDTIFGFEHQAGTLSVFDISYSELIGGEFRVDHASTVFTNESTVSLARLRELNLDLSAGATSTWSVTTLADVSGVDAYAAPEHLLDAGHVRSYSDQRYIGGDIEVD